MAYLTLLITIPLTVFAILFAISNGDDISVGLWPLEGRYALPVWIFGLGLLGCGFFLGALFVWLPAQKMRFRYWQESRKSSRLEKELEAVYAKTPPKETVPSLPAK